uniref:Uncharacterized protein n=1 Tax=Oryza rufipogon TaxID=4529 RepID=A0A0E0NAV1_ORYRU
MVASEYRAQRNQEEIERETTTKIRISTCGRATGLPSLRGAVAKQEVCLRHGTISQARVHGSGSRHARQRSPAGPNPRDVASNFEITKPHRQLMRLVLAASLCCVLLLLRSSPSPPPPHL